MERPVDHREVPEGYELAAEPDPDWRLVSGKRCRRGFGRGRPACTSEAVAELNRNARRPGARESWWAYCERHLYGRWVEDGKVMQWVLRERGTGQ